MQNVNVKPGFSSLLPALVSLSKRGGSATSDQELFFHLWEFLSAEMSRFGGSVKD